jgi:uncharacterized membrane protein YjdF
MPSIIIGAVGSILVIVNAIFAKVPTYHMSPVFLIPLIWAPYLLRRPLALLPSHYGLFVLAVLLHDIGAYGYYQHSPLPFSFDIAVHFYFAFAVAFAVHRVMETRLPLRPWQVELFTLMFMMGLGALHEVMEYGTYLIMGENGMLKTGSYIFDTNRDLTNNLLGTLLALAIMAIHRATQHPAASEIDEVDAEHAMD